MAIEKMIMVDLVGQIEDIDKVSRQIVLTKSLHQVNVWQEINSTNFKVPVKEENKDTLVDVCSIRPYTETRDLTDVSSKIKKLKELCAVKDTHKVSQHEFIMDYEVLVNKVEEVSSNFISVYDRLIELKTQKDSMARYAKNLISLKNIEVPIEKLFSLKNIVFEMYKVPKANMLKLKENYENIPSVIMKTSEDKDYNTIISFTPNILKTESDRVFKSLDCEFIELPKEYLGTPKQVWKLISERISEIENEIRELSKTIKVISKENARMIHIIERSMELENKSSDVKNNAARTNEFFYLCGWIPESFIKKFEHDMECFGDRLIISRRDLGKVNKLNYVPPTKLKNNNFIKPFEIMVGMYGTPSYNEIDPTAFLGISYMILFGMMFGDLGQGLVFVLAGLFMQFKMKSSDIGGVLIRLGMSSSIFGLVYGSFFGFENVIPALIIRPMENIMEVLIYAVIFGCTLLVISFIISMINSYKNKDLEEGLFSKDGLAGLTFYLLLLIFAYTTFMKIDIMPKWLWITIFVVLLTMILLKGPLTSIITNTKPLFHEKKSDYFIENGFGIVETLLSLFSNTVSFIRVGAFALNHVGLFLAFEALAHMMQNKAGSILMLLLGNIIIIGLEGLIVFIQGLRLEYYELFSKYYDGAGIAFEPVKILEEDNLKLEKDIVYKMEKNLVIEN